MRHDNPLSSVAMNCFVALIFAFLISPSIVVVILSFSSAPYLTFPPPGLSLQWYESYVHSESWMDATVRSVLVAGAVTVISLVLGTLAAIGLVRYAAFGSQLLRAILISPIIMPSIVLGIGLYYVFAKWHIVGTWYGLVLAHTVLATPFVIITVSAALSGVERTLEKAALSMGASAWRTFWSVLLPQIRSGVWAGAVFAFITSFDEIVVTMFIAGLSPTLPKKMYDGIKFEVSPTLTSVATVLIVVSAAVLILGSLMGRARTDRPA
ncbi:ABC transporter permease [bacterium]|nr:MAG: ABC transporter permease [bacterium]